MKERPPAPPILEELQRFALSRCTKCGSCCRMNFPITVRDNEIRAIAKHLGEPTSTVREEYFGHDPESRLACIISPCPFLSDPPESSCSVYPVRPRVCRDFPFLSDHARTCLIKENTFAVVPYCPAMVEAIEELKRRMLANGGKVRETRGEGAATIEGDLESIRRAREERA